MAGRIRTADVALVRDRTAIEDIIGEHVTLKVAGGGNLKGLCPFHDERSPSFNVTPSRGFWHCFGCGEGGDVITFLTKLEHLTFAEAVERLASRAGITLHYETSDGRSTRPGQSTGQRQRLIAANAAAAEFYAEQLLSPEARIAREFLAQRGFDRDAALSYGCGYAPDSWDSLSKHLRQKGFTAEDLIAAGLVKTARSGSVIDRFRGRLLWPIRDIGTDVIGFGARKLNEDDTGPKYLNTPETPLYKKSHVLYGIDKAKRDIAKGRTVVIVEGYTDVMACHLSGVPTAVATCGTSFGGDHISVLRRLLMDTDEFAGEIIFTFDGDEAGQRAALKAFSDEQKFMSQTFIAVAPDGMDPCELRLSAGDESVRELIAGKEPLVQFALRSVVAKFDLDTVEGRVGALNAGIPLVLQVKDKDHRFRYLNRLAMMTGEDMENVRRMANERASTANRGKQRERKVLHREDPRWQVEREALKLALQYPEIAGPYFDEIDESFYLDSLHQAIRVAIRDAGGAAAALGGANWVSTVTERCDLAAAAIVAELTVEPVLLPGDAEGHYVSVVFARVRRPVTEKRMLELKAKVQRMNPQADFAEYMRAFQEVIDLEKQVRGLHELETRSV